jgi:hypothetical protein
MGNPRDPVDERPGLWNSWDTGQSVWKASRALTPQYQSHFYIVNFWSTDGRQ